MLTMSLADTIHCLMEQAYFLWVIFAKILSEPYFLWNYLCYHQSFCQTICVSTLCFFLKDCDKRTLQ